MGFVITIVIYFKCFIDYFVISILIDQFKLLMIKINWRLGFFMIIHRRKAINYQLKKI